MQQRTIDKLRKKLTKERKRRSKIQGKLKLSQEQSLQLQEALNAANKENERLETAREAQVLHKTNFTKPLHIPRLEHQQLARALQRGRLSSLAAGQTRGGGCACQLS